MLDGPAFLFLLGRLLFGGYFVHAGVNHFRHTEAMTKHARSRGTPSPRAAVLGTGVLLVAGGLSVVLGVFPLVGLALLAIFLVGVTPVMHAFWKDRDPKARQANVVNFGKNVALLGAALALAAAPAAWALALGP
jgi:uncharacterized membrane protein YphA (DoxX/SURF4 family)